jgi:hypothetical protein
MCGTMQIGVLKGSDYKLQTATDEHRKKMTMLSECQSKQQQLWKSVWGTPQPCNQLVQT